MFSAAFSVLLLLFLLALSRGRGAYVGFLRWLDGPWAIAISAIILVGVLYHTATWFRLTTHIVVIRLGRVTVPPAAIGAGLVAAWIIVSVALAYFSIWF